MKKTKLKKTTSGARKQHLLLLALFFTKCCDSSPKNILRLPEIFVSWVRTQKLEISDQDFEFVCFVVATCFGLVDKMQIYTWPIKMSGLKFLETQNFCIKIAKIAKKMQFWIPTDHAEFFLFCQNFNKYCYHICMIPLNSRMRIHMVNNCFEVKKMWKNIFFVVAREWLKRYPIPF